MDAENAEQFAVLWTKSQAKVAAFVRTLVPNFHEADEIIQRVAVVLVRKFEQYDPDRPFVAWAIGAAKFEILNHRRQRVTDRHVFDNDLVEQLAASFYQAANEIDLRREALQDCLQRIESRPQKALALRYGEGLRLTDVARQLQVSVGSARMVLFRVRAALRDCIENKLQEFSAD